MSRRGRARKSNEPPELDITTFLNLMVVLVPFLLITAVFSRITIIELDLPAGASGAVDNKPKVIIEVIVRKDNLELGNGQGIVARIPNVDSKYDTKKLSEYLLKIKNNYPEKTDATILVEMDVEYNNMVLIMDAVRSAEIPQGADGEIEKVALFPDMSVGDAP